MIIETLPQVVFTDERIIDQPATAASAFAYRTACRVTQAKVAREIGVSNSQVRFLETAKRRWTAQTFNLYIAAVNKFATP